MSETGIYKESTGKIKENVYSCLCIICIIWDTKFSNFHLELILIKISSNWFIKPIVISTFITQQIILAKKSLKIFFIIQFLTSRDGRPCRGVKKSFWVSLTFYQEQTITIITESYTYLINGTFSQSKGHFKAHFL